MADAMSTLVWGLHAATGLDVYPAPKPVGAAVPCLTVQMVSDPIQDGNHNGGGTLHNSRVQIGHIGDYEVIRPYVQTVQTYLEGNKTDFKSAKSAGNYVERQDGNDIWMLMKDYFIQWKSN